MFTCTCGQKHAITPIKRKPNRRRGYAQTAPNAVDWQAQAKPKDITDHRIKQSFVLCSLLPVYWLTTQAKFLGPAQDVLQCMAFLFGICFVASVAGSGTAKAIVYWLERRTRTDWDRDGWEGDPADNVPAQPPSYTVDGERKRRAQEKSEVQKDREAFLRFVEIIASRQAINRKTGQRAVRNHALPHQRKVTDDFHKAAGKWLVDNGFAVVKSDKGWKLTATVDEIEREAVYLEPPRPEM